MKTLCSIKRSYIHTTFFKNLFHQDEDFFSTYCNLFFLTPFFQVFGSVFCKMWLTSDVLCCTASILNLCAIALDRYYALHDPIQHAQRRTVKFVLGIIVLVWLISCVICSPPLFGWNDWPDDWTDETECTLTSQKVRKLLF